MKALIEKGGKAQHFDPVPEITRKHFEEALRFARKSVTMSDLEKFEQFKRKFDPSFANKQGGGSSNQSSIKWPTSNVPGSGQNKSNDDDLYN